MKLYRLVYASAVNKKLNKTDLRSILSASATNNMRDHLTGALLFNSGIFLQILEGPRASLNAAYRRISKDERHTRLELIGLEPARERLFTAWSMALIEDNQASRKILFKFCGADKPVIDDLGLSDVCEMMMAMLKPTADK
jgi:hypothetical protein